MSGVWRSCQHYAAAQLAKYDRVRRGEIRWSNDAHPDLTGRDHPQRTIDLDANQ